MAKKTFDGNKASPEFQSINRSKIHLTHGASMSLEFTRLSEKGQVVIPNEMRKKMKLKEGTRFVILGLHDTIVLRKLEVSEERLRLKQLLLKARQKAEKIGFSQAEIERMLESSRKVVA